MQPNPRLSANLLVILVKTLVNLLVEPTKLRVMGAIGAPGPGNTLGRGSCAWLIVLPEDHGPWANPPKGETMMRLLLGILMRLLWDC